MKKRATRTFCLLALAFLVVVPGMAQAVQHFAVAPFQINGPDEFKYLSKGIQDMMVSRLHWAGNFEAMSKDKVNKATGGKPVTDDEASQLLGSLGVDYMVYGSVTVLGQEASVDVQVISAGGDRYPQTDSSSLDQLIPSLEALAGRINAQIFDRPGQDAAEAQGRQRLNAMNPDLVHNQSSDSQEFYLNPQFRYAGDAEASGRIRSRSLPYLGNSLAVGDADGDGRNECVIGGDNGISVYRFGADNDMEPLDTFELGHLLEVLRMSMIDLNRDGKAEIIASCIYKPVEMDVQTVTNKSQLNNPRAYIFNLENGKLKVVRDDIKLFLATTVTPPDYMPKLVGQEKGGKKVFESSVHEIIKMGGDYMLGPRLLLPPEANAFNFTYLPQKDAEYKVVLTDKKDLLRVYTRTGERVWTSDRKFSGSSLGIVDARNRVGLEDRLIMTDPYYVPMRMVPLDLDRNGQHEVLVNHPVSVAAQWFTRYRYFPQGEIHCLYWDGVGLSLVWKTRRIKGSVVDYGVGDINNDGIQDLYVMINTHPGMVGALSRRTAVLIYPLDTSEVDDKGVPIDPQFTEEQ